MSFRTALGRSIALVVFFVVLSPSVASAQFAWGLVNRVLHAEARGNFAHLPPDLVLGTNFGSFSHSADVFVAGMEVSSWMLSNGMEARLEGYEAATRMIDPEALASVLMVFDVFGGSPQFNLSYHTVRDPLGSFQELGGNVVIRHAGGGPVVFQRPMEELLFPPPPPTVHTFNLNAGRYEMLVSGSPTPLFGQVASGTAFFRMTGPPIPEPAGAAVAGAAALAACAARRPRRRRGRAVVQSTTHVRG